jgi:hypothetical protein
MPQNFSWRKNGYRSAKWRAQLVVLPKFFHFATLARKTAPPVAAPLGSSPAPEPLSNPLGEVDAKPDP